MDKEYVDDELPPVLIILINSKSEFILLPDTCSGLDLSSDEALSKCLFFFPGKLAIRN